MSGAIPPLPNTPSWRGTYLKQLYSILQITAVTHYLDSSNVYGSSQQVADSIREFKGGRLRVELKDGRQFPPSNNNKSALCDHISESEACYLAGITSPGTLTNWSRTPNFNRVAFFKNLIKSRRV
jgi:hypothetical protein